VKKGRLERDRTPLVSTLWLSLPLLFVIGSFPGAGKLLGTISEKPVGVGAAFQRLILAGERSGLQTHHRDDGKRFVVRAEEKLTAFVELESTIFAGALAQRAASTEFPS
jgi:hypothetical protein